MKIRGDKLILMIYINEYFLSRKVRAFFIKRELWEIIIERRGSLGLDTMITKTNVKQLTVYGDTKEYVSLKGAILNSALIQNLITESYVSRYNS